ncbi:unnamed protein product [Cuscuta epithymum]|uniref:DUF4283 domain-containing protein n=1 Tax=Cuscuta epithymum TaxID=186058 RepID=A0AAV0G9D3_9ASTE|nr:unnamed protein product [Cuscuta epithymum]
MNKQSQDIGRSVRERESKDRARIDRVISSRDGKTLDSELCIAAQIWTERRMNDGKFKAFIDTMANLSKPYHGVKGDVLDKEQKTFIFRFNDLEDKRRVLDEQPWHFKRHTIVINELHA